MGEFRSSPEFAHEALDQAIGVVDVGEARGNICVVAEMKGFDLAAGVGAVDGLLWLHYRFTVRDSCVLLDVFPSSAALEGVFVWVSPIRPPLFKLVPASEQRRLSGVLGNCASVRQFMSVRSKVLIHGWRLIKLTGITHTVVVVAHGGGRIGADHGEVWVSPVWS